ncbi:MAG: ABC transporter ATP-binding protein [Alphaproteobacteria bacterium]|nr:ABC transporter ATP-binding protein [Alphaproteobacteria bacterium]
MVMSPFKKITFQKQKHYFKEFWALKNVSFDVGKGEVVGIIGKNGSGKSTLLQVICGILNPNGGSCAIKGSVAALLELGSGFNPEFTGMENIYLYGQILGLSKERINTILPDILNFADIGEFVYQPVKTYSSGMMVRLAFAVSVSREPDIFIIDEALSVGDAAFSRKCFARIEEIRAKGTTILFVSHGDSVVVELCDRAIVLDKGELIYDGLPKTSVAHYTKLLFAPEAKRPEIRQAVIEEWKNTSPNVVDAKPVEEKKKELDILRPFFVEGLVSQSRLEYESLGALIEDAHIRTLDGKRVNVLVPSESYQYCYKVSFQKRATNVRFGMLIKTISGYALGGGVYPNNFDFIDIVEENDEYFVVHDFRCLLNQGIYFFNAGVEGTILGENSTVYLHRIIDAIMFKVQPQKGRFVTAIVDFDIKPIAKKVGVS